MAVKVYGSNVCPATLKALEIFTEHGYMPVFVNVTGSISLLKEFLYFRDTNPLYKDIIGSGSIGFPLFQLEDGTYTIDARKAFASVGIDASLSFTSEPLK